VILTAERRDRGYVVRDLRSSRAWPISDAAAFETKHLAEARARFCWDAIVESTTRALAVIEAYVDGNVSSGSGAVIRAAVDEAHSRYFVFTVAHLLQHNPQRFHFVLRDFDGNVYEVDTDRASVVVNRPDQDLAIFLLPERGLKPQNPAMAGRSVALAALRDADSTQAFPGTDVYLLGHRQLFRDSEGADYTRVLKKGVLSAIYNPGKQLPELAGLSQLFLVDTQSIAGMSGGIAFLANGTAIGATKGDLIDNQGGITLVTDLAIVLPYHFYWDALKQYIQQHRLHLSGAPKDEGWVSDGVRHSRR
jgi:hypothetical protein